jgi:hypothetical protein
MFSDILLFRVVFLSIDNLNRVWLENNAIESSVVNVGKANAPTDGRLPSQHIIGHTGLNKSVCKKNGRESAM